MTHHNFQSFLDQKSLSDGNGKSMLMAQLLTKDYAGTWFHLMMRGIRNESIFLEARDYKAFLDILTEASQLWDAKIAAYCLLPNRYHLLVQAEYDSLSRFIAYIKGRYTGVFHKFHGGRGPLLQRGYRSIPVEEDPGLLDLIRYIHRIPLQESRVHDPDTYEWSSYKGYTSTAARWNWLHKEPVLSMIPLNQKKPF